MFHGANLNLNNVAAVLRFRLSLHLLSDFMYTSNKPLSEVHFTSLL